MNAAKTQIPAHTPIQNFSNFRDAMNAEYFERTNEVDCIIHALVAGQHVLLLGPPGTAKSAIVKSFSKAIGGNYFNLLMTRFTTPDEVFGPVSLKGLEEDRYERVTSSYLPEAEVVFLDEIFKANSPILNALLTALNEREFDNGGSRMPLPLEMCIGASNELPQEESLAALYDRFMLRCWVGGIRDQDNFVALIQKGGAKTDIGCQLTREDIAWMREACDRVDITPVIDAIVAVRQTLATKHEITASDRRWVKCMKLIKASAALQGREAAVPRDLLILQHALWDQPEDRDNVRKAVIENLNRHMTKALELRDAAKEAFDRVAFGDLKNFTSTAGPANGAIRGILKQLKALPPSEDMTPLIAEVTKWRQKIATELSEQLNF